MTIRRDIDYLERRHLARRVAGGAIAAGKVSEPPFEARAAFAAVEKAHLAIAVVGMLEPHQVVILDSGSTVLAVAKAIRGQDFGLTVVTPSVLALLELLDEPNTSVILAGGTVRPPMSSASPFAF